METPDTIWHYTSLSALKNFGVWFKGKCAAAFADKDEILYGQQYLPDEIKKYPTLPPEQYFIGCFSEYGDNELHWKARTMNGGVALGFNSEKIKNRFDFFHCSVYYSIEEYQAYINKKIQEYKGNELEEGRISNFSTIAPAILKNEKWEWEKEYRIFTMGDSDDKIGEFPAKQLFMVSELFEQAIMSPYSERAEDISIVCNFLIQAGINNPRSRVTKSPRWMVCWDENTKRTNGLKLRKGKGNVCRCD